MNYVPTYPLSYTNNNNRVGGGSVFSFRKMFAGQPRSTLSVPGSKRAHLGSRDSHTLIIFLAYLPASCQLNFQNLFKE